MCSDYTSLALMYVDYGGDTYAGMGIKAMKSFGRSRGRKKGGLLYKRLTAVLRCCDET